MHKALLLTNCGAIQLVPWQSCPIFWCTVRGIRSEGPFPRIKLLQIAATIRQISTAGGAAAVRIVPLSFFSLLVPKLAGAAVCILLILDGSNSLVEISQRRCHLVSDFALALQHDPPTGFIPVHEPATLLLDLFHNLKGDLLFHRLVCIEVAMLVGSEHAPKGDVSWMVLTRLAPVEENIVYTGTLDTGVFS